MGVRRPFHVNINCTDFQESLAFYEWLGFQVVNDLGEGGSKAIQQGLAMTERPVGRAALLQAGDDPRSLRIDLIEWKTPRVEGATPPNLWTVGMSRLALICDNLLELCEQAAERGIEVLSEPVMPARTTVAVRNVGPSFSERSSRPRRRRFSSASAP